MRKIIASAAVLSVALGGCKPQAVVQPAPSYQLLRALSVQVVPRPRSVRLAASAWLTLHGPVRIEASSPQERSAAQVLEAMLLQHGVRSSRVGGVPGEIALRCSNRVDARLGGEGYRIEVGRHGVALSARSAAGLFYAVQTLDQLLQHTAPGVESVPLGTVADWPAYAWRGVHVDVSRHFFSVTTIEHFIDLAAHYKLNVLHLHLTDDQAWRIQIARYPLLTSKGSCTANGCEFYTQAQIQEIVSYATARFVRIVPEIEMPGHASAAIRAYPGLACVSSTRSNGLACTVDFYKNVLAEVMQLFPGTYVHLGGDEVVYGERNATLLKQVAQFVRAHGRKVIVWDDARVAQMPDVTFMIWHATVDTRVLAPDSAAIMSPDGPLYFDAYQGDPRQEPPAAMHLSTLEEVYAYNPEPERRMGPQGSHVLGAQANLWTEKIASPEHLFYMALPRALALSEIVWTPASLKDWNSFEERLPQQLRWLDRHGFFYRIPNPWMNLQGGHLAFTSLPGRPQAVSATSDAARVWVRMGIPIPGARIHYTVDGSVPSQQSQTYTQPFVLTLDEHAGSIIRFAAFLPNGRRSAISECTIRRMPHVRPSKSTWRSLVSP